MTRSQLTLLVAVLASGSMAFGQQDFRSQRNNRNSSGSSGFTGTTEQPSNATPRAKELAQAYNILLNTSIFARDRRSGAIRPEVAAADPPPVPENYLTVRGVGWVDGQMTAIIEDTRDNSSVRARVGDSVGTGKVASLANDELVYETKDGLQKRHIPLGDNLLGREMEAPVVASADSTSSQSSLQDLQNFFRQRGGGRNGPGGFNNFGGFNNNNGFGNNGFGNNGGRNFNNFGGNNFSSNNGGGFNNRNQFGTNGGGFDPTQQRRQRGGGNNLDATGGAYDPNAGGGGRRRQRGGGGGGGMDSGIGG